jgi:cyanate permease
VASSIVGPLLTGWVRDATGSLEGAFYAAAGVIVVGVLLALLPREAVRGEVVGRRIR